MNHFLLPWICFSLFNSGPLWALSYTELTLKLEEIRARYPQVTQVLELSENDEGRKIPGLRVSRTPSQIDTSKIGYLIVGGHHGNEPHSVTLALHVARTLAMQMSVVRFQSPTRDTSEWWIIPAVNISGMEKNTRWENGKDPNRQYPGPCFTAPNPSLKSVQAVQALLETRPFTATATLHGYIGTLTSPWGITTSSPQTADNSTYEKWLRAASLRNGYRWGTSSDLIYPANGTFEDFTYWKYGAWSLLVELKNGNALDLVMTTDAILEFFSAVDRTRTISAPTEIRCLQSAMPDLFLE